MPSCLINAVGQYQSQVQATQSNRSGCQELRQEQTLQQLWPLNLECGKLERQTTPAIVQGQIGPSVPEPCVQRGQKL